MEDETLGKLKALLPSIKSDFIGQVKPIYDPSQNCIHFQTDPYVDVDGVIRVKRIRTVPVIVELSHHVIEEYERTVNYDKQGDAT